MNTMASTPVVAKACINSLSFPVLLVDIPCDIYFLILQKPNHNVFYIGVGETLLLSLLCNSHLGIHHSSSGLVLTTCELAKIQKSSHLLIQFADVEV